MELVSFIVANWVCTLGVAAVLFNIFSKYKHLLLKPSIWYILFFNLQLQWGSAFTAAVTFDELERPWHFFILTQLFPFVLLVVSVVFLPKQALDVWRRFEYSPNYSVRTEGGALLVLGVAWFVTLAIYLHAVPLTQTGLYASFAGASMDDALWAREYSVKLLASALPRYCYAANAWLLSILLFVIMASIAGGAWRTHKIYLIPLPFVLGVVFLFTAMLSGARAEGGVVLLGAALYYWLKAGSPFRIRYLIVGFLVVVSIPVIVDFARQRTDISWDSISESRETILYRIFVLPTDVGRLWLKTVEGRGLWGVVGIEKVASVLGLEPVNVANEVAQAAAPSSPFRFTSFASTGFPFSYYSFFGLAIVPCFVPAVLLLDFSLYVYRFVSEDMRLVLFVYLVLSVRTLIESDYTTTLFTFGFIPAIALCVCLRLFVVKRRESYAN